MKTKGTYKNIMNDLTAGMNFAKALKKECTHIWKYMGSYERVCEAPIPTIPSCGRAEILDDDGTGNGPMWVAYEQGKPINKRKVEEGIHI